MDKIKIKEIILERLEGKREKVIILVPKAWEQANAKLTEWSLTAPQPKAYDKVHYELYFYDGYFHQGRIDIYQPSYKLSYLTEHVLSDWKFYSGLHCPLHLTQDQYQNLLKNLKIYKDKYLKLLEKYQIGDE